MRTKFMNLLEEALDKENTDLWLLDKIELSYNNEYLDEKQYNALLVVIANRKEIRRTKFMDLLEKALDKENTDLWLLDKTELSHDNDYLDEKQYNTLLVVITNRNKGTEIKKSDIVKEAVMEQNWKKALQITKSFRIGITQDQRIKMERAYECIVHPNFYQQIGTDIPRAIEEGKTIVKEYVETIKKMREGNHMKRVYYTINEKSAKLAHEMMSFSEYKSGSRTAEYQQYVNKAYDLADKVAEAKPNEADRVYMLAERYSKKMSEYINTESHIGTLCPSVMISGAGNFPVRKKEKQNQAWEKNHQFFNEIQGILSKMENILYGKEQIKSSDNNAVEKLTEKLSNLKNKQEQMKAANKAVRMKDLEKGNEKLKNMGYSDEQIKQLREPDFCGRIGYPDYELRNNNSNIHRIEERLKILKAEKEHGIQKMEYGSFRVVENTDIMRLQIFFEDKPESEIREILKSNGFRWAPSQMAWQRQLTNNARYALKRVVCKLKEIQEIN